MDRYIQEEQQTSFDTSQFSELQAVGALSHFTKTRKILAFSVGVGGSIISLIHPTNPGSRSRIPVCGQTNVYSAVKIHKIPQGEELAKLDV